MTLIDEIPDDWRAALADPIDTPTFRRLIDVLAAERARTDTAIYPPEPLVFNALRLTPLDSVRAVILGQDPYHGEGQAHGLAFSVPAGVKPPPSLGNILAEWESDTDLAPARSGSLEPWARHGVLLLNTVLTVRRGSANSHRRIGWTDFTDAIVRAVAARQDPVAFLLWGRPAQRKRPFIDEPPHLVIASNHPSPLSANRAPVRFVGSKPFSRANEGLVALGQDPIDWNLKPVE
jgi:uracil-DNA glycosylase